MLHPRKLDLAHAVCTLNARTLNGEHTALYITDALICVNERSIKHIRRIGCLFIDLVKTRKSYHLIAFAHPKYCLSTMFLWYILQNHCTNIPFT